MLLTELETEFLYFASMQCCCSRRLGASHETLRRVEKIVALQS